MDVQLNESFKSARCVRDDTRMLRFATASLHSSQANGRLPISDIAAAVGYDDPVQLTRLFRREVGITPSQYRRERLV